MIIFLHDNLGYKVLKYIKKKDSSSIEKIILVKNDQSKLNLFARKFFSKKIIYWKSSNKNRLFYKLKSTKTNIMLLIWWPFILDKKIYTIKKYCLNTHPSYLPYFKGKDPNFWSILKGGPFGVTIHHVNNKIDSGPIAFQSKIENVDWTWNAKKLYKHSITELFKLFRSNFQNIVKSKIPKIEQKKKFKKINFRKDMLTTSLINLNSKFTAKGFLNLLRAKSFPPYNGIMFNENKNKYSININIKKIKD